MKKWRNKILSAVLTLSLLLTTTSFAFAVGEGDTADYGTKIEPSEISLEGSSNPGSGSATNAFDGNTNTTWESAWSPLDESRFITLDLGTWTYLSHLTFIPRKSPASGKDQYNGTPKYLYIYTSNVTADIGGGYNDEDYNWTLAKIVDWSDLQDYVDSWNNTDSKEKVHADKEIYFNNNISTRYIKLYAPRTYSDSSETLYITDLTFYENTATSNANVPTITTQPQSAEYVNASEIQGLSVTATNASSYQWYKTEDGTLDSGAEIPNATAPTYQPSDFGSYFVKVTSSDGSYVFSNIAEISTYEAKISGTDTYGTLSSLIESAEDGQTIELIKDIIVDESLPTIDKSLTITSEGETRFTVEKGNSLPNTSPLFTVSGGNINVQFNNITLDGGADWYGENNDTLNRGTLNQGVDSMAPILKVSGGATVGINEGTILQNNKNDDGYGNGGGAVLVDGGSTGSTLNINGGEIRNNYCSQHGSAVLVKNDNSVLNFISGIISGNSNNKANSKSAALCMDHGSTLNMYENARIVNNIGYNGGAIWSADGKININGGDISGNSAENGGAIYMSGNCTVNLNGATISDNTATNGGAVYVNNGTANFNSGTITGNTATTNGGAVYVNAGTVNLGGATITDNTATSGGAVYVNGGTANFNSGTITGNTATSGGALYLQGGTVNLGADGRSNELKISGNTASSNGNGMFFNGSMVKINAILDLDDNIYYIGNSGKTIAINTDLTGSKPITIINDSARTAEELLNAKSAGDKESEYISAALNVFRVLKSNAQKETYYNVTDGSDFDTSTNKGSKYTIRYVSTNIFNIDVSLNAEVNYYKGIDNSIFKVTKNGTEVSYKWYVLNNNTGLYEKVDSLDSLDNGIYSVYCVATDQNGDVVTTSNSGHYLVSNVATVTVKDFVPCSQAIAKFKGI